MKVLVWSLLLLSGFALGWLARGLEPATETAAVVEAVPAGAVEDAGREAGSPGLTELTELTELAELEALLAAQDWEAAVEYYAAREDPGREPELAARLRQRLLDEARQASGRPQLEAAQQLLQQYTWYYHRDQEALQLLATTAERLGRPGQALEALLDALEVALSGPDPEPARQRVVDLVDALVAGRLQIGDRRGAMALYEQVLARDPLNYRYRYLLARQQHAAGDAVAAGRQLDQIPEGAYDRRAVADLRQRLREDRQLAERYGEGVPLQRLGNHYLVEVVTDGGRTLSLLLDTGASRSVLKPTAIDGVARAERLPGSIRVGTANGVVEAVRYRLPGLTLGPFRIGEPEVVRLSLDGLERADGLLGMDILDQFDYRIDPHNQRLLLTRRGE